MSRRSEFHSQPTQSTPGTSDQPTDLGKRLLRRERLRQKQERRRQLARRSDQGALSECPNRAPLLTGRVKAHRNVVQRNGTSRTRNRRSPANQSLLARPWQRRVCREKQRKTSCCYENRQRDKPDRLRSEERS